MGWYPHNQGGADALCAAMAAGGGLPTRLRGAADAPGRYEIDADASADARVLMGIGIGGLSELIVLCWSVNSLPSRVVFYNYKASLRPLTPTSL